jgi:hypothetical protein
VVVLEMLSRSLDPVHDNTLHEMSQGKEITNEEEKKKKKKKYLLRIE